MIWDKRQTRQNSLFVSIGAGINQIPLIEEAKKLGLYVIGVDNNILAPGIHICDIKIQESIENHNEIYIKLKELLVDGEIIGVLAKSFGTAIKTTSYISGRLNIPHIPFNRIDDFINKERMKNVFKQNNINSPDFNILPGKSSNTKKIKIPFPFVIKPVTGHAKNEVELINDSKNLEKYKKAISSKSGDYIIEKYVSGDEIIAVGLIHNSKFYLVELTDKVKSPLPYFVDIMHISPSKYSQYWDRIQEIGQNITESFGIQTSPLIMELIIAENEDILVIEAAPEFGGEFLSDILVPESTGYNIIKESIKAVINNNFNPPSSKRSRNSVVVKYLTGNKGTLLSFNPLIHKSRGILFSRIFKDIGSLIKPPTTNHDRIGVIVTKGRTKEEALETANKAEESLNIRIGEKEPAKKSSKVNK